jgi:hypothetical protein
MMIDQKPVDTGKETTPRRAVLLEAADLIDGERAHTYGPPAQNLNRIANLWSAYLEREISARDVAWLMVLLKVAREAAGHSRDSSIDAAGYAAIAHEVAA